MKTIKIRDDTYPRPQGGEDSFSAVIDRLISRKNRDLRADAGALRDSKVVCDLSSRTRKMRRSA